MEVKVTAGGIVCALRDAIDLHYSPNAQLNVCPSLGLPLSVVLLLEVISAVVMFQVGQDSVPALQVDRMVPWMTSPGFTATSVL